MGVKLVSSGAGSVELVAPVTASNYTATMPAKTGTVMIDGPAFSAYNSSAQSVANGTWTAVQLQTESFDTASCFNNTSGTVGGIPAYSFLPNVAGYYQISGNVTIAQTGSYYETVAIYKNGAVDKAGSITFASAGSYPSSNVSAVVYLNGSTDYVTLYVLHAQGSAQNTVNIAANTYFTGALVRGA